MKKIFLVGWLMLICLLTYSQSSIFNLDDLFKSRKLYPDNLSQVQWIPQSQDYVYVKDNALLKGTTKDTLTKIFIPLSDINYALTTAGLTEIKSFPGIQHWTSNSGFYFQIQEKLIHYNINKKAIDKQIDFSKEAKNTQIDFDHAQIAYTIENNLFVIKENGKAIQVNKETPDDVRFGHIVHRNEFGINQGFFLVA